MAETALASFLRDIKKKKKSSKKKIAHQGAPEARNEVVGEEDMVTEKNKHKHKHKHRKKKRQRDERVNRDVAQKHKKKKKRRNKDKESRASKKEQRQEYPSKPQEGEGASEKEALHRVQTPTTRSVEVSKPPLNFPYQYILAPMVGASELAFRLLCRKYGAQLAYTPMMSAHKFANDADYRREEFLTCPADRPLVCHFSANDPRDFAKACQVAAPFCDAVDLNLGCPQRTAYLGHFGSYLLDKKDRKLVCDIVRAGATSVKGLPVFSKIRLLDTLEETIELCQQLSEAGVSLIAVHARYRASWERKGPGARDGPALLEQVAAIKKAVTDIPIIANGNIITFEDVQGNLKLTGADGVMSAEGILDNPALFLPRYGSRDDFDKEVNVRNTMDVEMKGNLQMNQHHSKKKRKLLKKLRKIDRIEHKIQPNDLNDDEKQKLAKKGDILSSLEKLDREEIASSSAEGDELAWLPTMTATTLGELYESSDDKLQLAKEYLSLARVHPVKIRSVVFHIRRMLKDVLLRYQLLEDCLGCETIDQMSAILQKIRNYMSDPASFVYDREKAREQKEALEKKRREEGKRKAYEARMIRKAKREGKADLHYYLYVGAAVPTQEAVKLFKALPREKALLAWKEKHSQHCMSFHLDPEGCKRGRTCAFLHADAVGMNTFVEKEEVAG